MPNSICLKNFIFYLHNSKKSSNFAHFFNKHERMKALNEMTIAMACDHAGFGLKHLIQLYLEREGAQVKDFGCFEQESCDYPDYVHPLAEAIGKGEYEFGIVIDGNGNGSCMTANRHAGVRAAVCWDVRMAKFTRQHNNANVLAIPAGFVTSDNALLMVDEFFSTDFEGGRHEKRVAKIDK